MRADNDRPRTPGRSAPGAAASAAFAAFYDPSLSFEDNYRLGPFLKADSAASAPAESQEPSATPMHEFLGRPVRLPFGIPAGPLVHSRSIQAALAAGFDLPVYKTVRTRAWASHPWPNVLAVDVEGDRVHPTDARLTAHNDFSSRRLSVTNSFGVPSMDPDVWQPDMAAAVKMAGPGQVVIGSFQGTPGSSGSVSEYIADFVAAARLVRETGVQILEVNLSCPNEGTSHLLCFDTERAAEVIEAIKAEIGDLPLIAKIAYFADEEALQRLVDRVGRAADAIAAINTISAEIVDGKGRQALPGEGRMRSGVGGSAIRWAGLEMVERLGRLREELGLQFRIVGIGGVSTPADYAAYRVAGAHAAMSATAAMWNPSLATEIKQGMRELAHAH